MTLDPSVLEIIRATVRETLKQLRTNPPIVPRALNTRDASIYLGISASKLSRLRHLGRVPFIQIDRAIRFLPEDLDRLLGERREKG